MTDFLVRHFIKNHENLADPAVRTATGVMAGVVGIVCNLLLFAGKLIIGLWSGSISITADAVNNLSDASANITTMLGFWVAAKPADEEHPYGHARSEYIAGLFVAMMILFIGFQLIKSSVDKILKPEAVQFGLPLVAVLVLSILVKFWMSRFNARVGARIESLTLKATAQDSLNDVFSTTAVLVSAVVGHFTGWKLDGWMGAAVALFILYSGGKMLKETLSPLLGEAPSADIVDIIERELAKEPLVLDTHDFMVHSYGHGRVYATAHVEIDSKVDPLEAHDLIDELERHVQEKDGIHLIIHYDPVLVGDPYIDQIREMMDNGLQKLDQRLSYHDLRVVRGPHHTNIIFDIVKPYDMEMKDAELKRTVTGALQQIGKDQGEKWFPVVTVERQFAPAGPEEEKEPEGPPTVAEALREAENVEKIKNGMH